MAGHIEFHVHQTANAACYVCAAIGPQADLWAGYRGPALDKVEIELWQAWLLPATEAEFLHQQANRRASPISVTVRRYR